MDQSHSCVEDRAAVKKWWRISICACGAHLPITTLRTFFFLPNPVYIPKSLCVYHCPCMYHLSRRLSAVCLHVLRVGLDKHLAYKDFFCQVVRKRVPQIAFISIMFLPPSKHLIFLHISLFLSLRSNIYPKKPQPLLFVSFFRCWRIIYPGTRNEIQRCGGAKHVSKTPHLPPYVFLSPPLFAPIYHIQNTTPLFLFSCWL